MNEYTIRWCRPTDVDAFLALFRRVLDGDYGRDWFAWKYEDNPYVDHVPIVVVESDDELVGARAFFGLRMDIGGEQYTALEPCDTMVRTDHRRKGLFTRMNERAIERYRREAPSFFFNFPNPQSLPGNLKLGWREIAKLHTHYRIADPARLTASRTSNAGLRIAGRLLAPIGAAYYGLRDATTSIPDGVSVRRESGVPADVVASIYRASSPAGIHAVRDETFYRWRFNNPNRTYATYVAEGSGRPTAVIVGRSADAPAFTVKITDVVPAGDGDRTAEQLALLDRIVSDHSEAAILSAPSRALSPATLRQAGFHSDGAFPLSRVGTPRTHVVRSLDGWKLNGIDLGDPDNWNLTFAEVDSS